jgi:hypothetical protein
VRVAVIDADASGAADLLSSEDSGALMQDVTLIALSATEPERSQLTDGESIIWVRKPYQVAQLITLIRSVLAREPDSEDYAARKNRS